MRAPYRRDPWLVWTITIFGAFAVGVVVGAIAAGEISAGLESALAGALGR